METSSSVGLWVIGSLASMLACACHTWGSCPHLIATRRNSVFFGLPLSLLGLLLHGEVRFNFLVVKTVIASHLQNYRTIQCKTESYDCSSDLLVTSIIRSNATPCIAHAQLLVGCREHFQRKGSCSLSSSSNKSLF